MVDGFRKVLGLTVGVIVSYVAHFVITLLIFVPFFIKEAKAINGNFLPRFLIAWGFLFLVFLPISVFAGAIVTGLIYQPPNGLNIKHSLVWTPGLYIALYELLGLLKMPAALLQVVGCIIAFFLPSWWGVKTGIRLKRKWFRTLPDPMDKDLFEI